MYDICIKVAKTGFESYIRNVKRAEWSFIVFFHLRNICHNMKTCSKFNSKLTLKFGFDLFTNSIAETKKKTKTALHCAGTGET